MSKDQLSSVPDAPATGGASGGNGWSVESETSYPIAPGVNYTHRRLVGNMLSESVHVIEIDTKNPHIALKAFSSCGKVGRLETVGNMLRQLESRGNRVVAGVNADFFSYVGVPSGLQITDGEVITSPKITKVYMAVLADGTVKLGECAEMTATLTVESGFSIELDAINRHRTMKHTDHAMLYTTRFGDLARTPEGGVEAVIRLRDPDDRLLPGRCIVGRVESVKESSGTRIEGGTYVLSATGSKGEWVRERLTAGKEVSFHLSYDQGIDKASQVVSGNSTLAFVLLKDGKISPRILDPGNPLNSDRHPRTMISTKQGRLYLVAVDGRQPGHSDGITMAEGACYLQSLGMEEAINVDGGGSTACYVRQPGDAHPNLANRPSDGFERAVGNALAIVTHAPVSELAQLMLQPASPVKVLVGSKIPWTVKGTDRFFNAVAIQPEQLVFRAEGKIGAVGPDGLFIAGATAGKGRIGVRCGGLSQTAEVTVTKSVARLVLEPARAAVAPGATAVFELSAYDERGGKVWISPEVFAWGTEGCIGTLDSGGVLQAAKEAAQGKVTAAFGTLKAEAVVQIGKPPQMIADFERLDGLDAVGVRAVPGSVVLAQAARPQPVRFGTFSAKLSYDFTGMTGVSKAGIRFLDSRGGVGREIEGEPCRFGVWVFGDAGGHWLRLAIADADGQRRSINLTDPGGLRWKGWKYVCADIPKNTRFPVTVHSLYIAETSDANKHAGVIYFDNFRAEYTEPDEDVEGPVFSRLLPEPHSVQSDRKAAVSAIVTDSKSGVDPSSIRMWLNGAVVKHDYDPVSGTVAFHPDEELQEGEYRVVIEAADRAGNASVPPAEWTFYTKHTIPSSSDNTPESS